MAKNTFLATIGADTSKFESSLKKLGGLLTAAFSVRAIAQFTLEAAKLGAQIEGVRNSFEKFATPQTLNDLRNATRGTVTDLQLMQSTIQARNFKIPLTELATFFEFATKRALETGQSVDYLVESIILGIGRKSPLILDNLGISAIELRQKLKGVGMESASVGDVSKAMGQIIDDELRKMGSVADTAAISYGKLSVAFSDFKMAWGDFVNESKTIRGVVTWATDIFKMLSDESLTFWEKFFGNPDEYNAWKRNFENAKKLTEEALPGYMSGFGGSKKFPSFAPPDVVQEQAKTLKLLSEELEKLKDVLENIDITDTQRIQTTLKEIKAIEDKIVALKTLRSEQNISGMSQITGLPYVTQNGIQSPGLKNIKQQVPEAYKFTKELQAQQEAINLLSSSFTVLFTSVDNGFANMMDNIIAGLKRIAAELIAKAVVLKLITLLFAGTGFGGMAATGLQNLLSFPGLGGGSSSGGGLGSGAGLMNMNSNGKIIATTTQYGKQIRTTLMRDN